MPNSTNAGLLALALIIPLHASMALAQSSATQGAFMGAKETTYPQWFKESFLDVREDAAEAAEHGKRLIYFFHQDGCPYCNALVERNLSQKDIVETIQEHFDVVELNIWGDREVIGVDGSSTTEKIFSSDLAVQFTPTMIFYDERADKVLRLNGYVPPQQFRLALDYVSMRQEDRLAYREYVEQNAPESASSRKLISKDFFMLPPYDLSNRSGKPLAVFFEQGDCPNCETLHDSVLVDQRTVDEIQKFDAVQLDMWSTKELVTPSGAASTARQWASDLGVSYAPTIIFFDADGNEVIRSEAWFKIFHTQSLFAYVSSEAFRAQPNFQRYLSNRADHFIEQGIDVDIWN